MKQLQWSQPFNRFLIWSDFVQDSLFFQAHSHLRKIFNWIGFLSWFHQVIWHTCYMLGWYGLSFLKLEGDFLEFGRVRIWDFRIGSMQSIAKKLAHLFSTTLGTTGALGAGVALGAETLDGAGALLGVEVL